MRKVSPVVNPPESPHRMAIASGIRCDNDGLTVTTAADHREWFIPWRDVSPRLAAASYAERAEGKLSPGGYGIHWPLLDEDMAVGPRLATAVISGG